MRILRNALIFILAIAGAVLALGLFIPQDYTIERSISIDASKEMILDQIKSLKNMQEWSPWAEKDPEMKVSYEGNDAEVGSISKWEGNDEVGKGIQEVTAITENLVETKLTILEPWEMSNKVQLELTEENEATKVTWRLQGTNPYPLNAFSIFMDMDKMLGKDFENGLAKLKARCESIADKINSEPKLYRGYEIHVTTMEPKAFIAKKENVAFEKIGVFYETHLPAIFEATGKAGLQPAGSPCGLFYKWDHENGTTDMAAALPVSGDESVQVKGFEKINISGGKALHIAYYGAYEKSEEAHYAMDDFMKENELELNELVLEEYVTDPTTEPDTSKWLTNIYYLVK